MGRAPATGRFSPGSGGRTVRVRGRQVAFLRLVSADPARPNRADRRIVAAAELADGGAYVSFLVPVPGPRLIRVIALDFAHRDLDHLCAAVLLCPPGGLSGLRVLELRVLGLLVEGITDVPALARSLHIAEQAVAEALERCMAALRTNDLTAASVRALRGGMRIPSRLA